MEKRRAEFPVIVSWHKTRGYHAYIPSPVMEELGDPDMIKFVKKGKRVEVEAHKD